MDTITNKDLLIEIEKSKANKKITDNLGRMFIWIATRYGKRINYVNRSYVDDMIELAILKMVEGYARFDPEKSDNPFAYLHTIAGCAFANYISKEHRQKEIAEERYEES